MSFSKNVKTELCSSRVVLDEESLRCRLFGMYACFHRGVSGKYIFKSENRFVIEYFVTQLTRLCKGADEYCQIISDGGMTSLLMKDKISIQSCLCNCDKLNTPAILSGIFLACGFLNEPSKSYRLDFLITSPGQMNLMKSLVADLGYELLLSERGGYRYAYVKDSDAIEELLNAIGAEQAAMDIMNVKIYKNMRNTANRITNCETANISKTVAAASEIVDKINWIMNEKGLSILPEDLRQTAQLRLDNPELSLRELAELMVPKISRSGLNHRLKKISSIAEGLQRKGE